MAVCRGNERERNGYYSSRDIKRDTSHKVQSLGYQKEDKEDDEDFDKSSTLRSSKMHKRE